MAGKKELSGNCEGSSITESQVREYLEAHPDFFHNTSFTERDLGEGVVDFQYHLLKNLQNNSKNLNMRYNLLVDYCRENLSIQTQIHNAVLSLMRTRGIEQLLEFLTIDLLSLFNLDVVRIGMETDAAFDTSYGEQNYSGIVFIDNGTTDMLFSGKLGNKNTLLIKDSDKFPIMGFSQIFANCEQQIKSYALLRLTPEHAAKNIILALGVREKERFHSGQGTELLNFFAQAVSLELDKYLDELTV